MSKPEDANDLGSGRSFRFSLAGLIVLCLCLVAGSSFLTSKLFGVRQKRAGAAAVNASKRAEQEAQIRTQRGPWGELLTQNIRLERPVEYLSEELKNVQPPVWTFRGMNTAQAKLLFVANGLSQQEAEKALASDRVITQGTNVFFRPSEDFVFALSPETRERLYGAMRGLAVSTYLDSPYYYAKDHIQWVSGEPGIHPEDLVLFKKLVYGGDDIRRFSDYETLMCRIPTFERRVAMASALSRQDAVLAKLCIRPDTDIDKVATYWGQVPNVRFIDVRPMLEALKRLPRGGSMSLTYLLPPFARERLFTYPSPGARGEPMTDCDWTTFNFSNVNPDNRFLDPASCARYIDESFYKIAQPTLYGDVLLFRNDRNESRHSAVFLADDLVFSKQGKNCAMPWVIERIGDLQAAYSNCKIVYLRKKTD